MKIEVLISTMNRKSINDLELEKKNILENCIIINQITNNELEIINEELEEKNIKMISYREKGLSKSRNRALENSTADIIILTDDDISFLENSLLKIKDAFRENQDADILTFKFEKDDSSKNKKYKKNVFIHNYKTIRKISSVEIAIRRESIIKKNIRYDENFGLGARYISGEENIFLKDCLDKGLKLKYIPTLIAKHPNESESTPYNWTESYMESKGPLAYRLYGTLGYIYFILLILSKRKRIKNKNILKNVYLGFKCIREYKKSSEKK